MNLLKYNWKYNKQTFLVTLVVQLLIYSTLIIGISFFDWLDVVGFAFGFMNVTIGLFVYLIYVLVIFNNSLKSTYRRIIPVYPWQEVIAIWIQLLIYCIINIIVFLLFFLLLYKIHVTPELTRAFSYFFEGENLLTGLLSELWSNIVFTTWIMLVMTITYSFKWRYRVWIGIACFLVIVVMVTTLQSFILTNETEIYSLFSIVVMENWLGSVSHDIEPSFTAHYSYYLFDAVAIIVSLFIISYLMNKRIEL